MIIVNHELVEVPISDLLDCSIQPGQRKKRVTLNSSITKSIDKNGLLTPPSVKRGQGKFAGKYFACDGHRRIKACTLLGYETITCNLSDSPLTPEELLLIQNGVTSYFTPTNNFTAWALGESGNRDHIVGVIEDCSESMGTNVRNMIRIFGKKRAVEIGLNGRVSPSVQQTIFSLNRAFENALNRSRANQKNLEDAPEVGVIGEYLVDQPNKRISLAKVWLKHRASSVVSARKFIRRIQEGADFPDSEW
jgi:hypothetical protein